MVSCSEQWTVYEGSLIVKCALQLAPLVFVRPGELRKAEWNDIDLDKAEWRFTITKTNTPHIVPLAKQAIAILEEIKPLTRNGQYVFPSGRSTKRPMSDNAILAAMRRMGIEKDEMTGHGFRAMARTILDEVLGFRPDFIEHQLAHAVRDPNGRAYNRTAHLKERKKMMQEWADYLDKLKQGAEIISIPCVVNVSGYLRIILKLRFTRTSYIYLFTGNRIKIYIKSIFMPQVF